MIHDVVLVISTDEKLLIARDVERSKISKLEIREKKAEGESAVFLFC